MAFSFVLLNCVKKYSQFKAKNTALALDMARLLKTDMDIL
jgi:hypothetical protein